MKPLAKALKNKIVGATSDVISAPARYKAFKSGLQANNDVSTLKRARAYDKAPDTANGGDAGRTRFMAQSIRDRITK